MISPGTFHEIKDIAVTIAAVAGTGVSTAALRYLRNVGRIGKALTHAPSMLHTHTEKEGNLIYAGVRWLEQR